MSDEISLARGWTLEAYVSHNEAMRQQEERWHGERDRRITEVGVEREKALKIKETADLAALGLAREIQTYKDEKANELRSQIERERGSYATKDDLSAAIAKVEVSIKPLSDFVTLQQGRQQGVGVSANVIAFAVTALIGIAGVVLAVYIGSR